MSRNVNYSKRIVRAFALFVATTLFFFESSYNFVGAQSVDYTYKNAWGSGNPDEEFYIWYKVEDDNKPMYEYLSDGDNPDYSNGKKKTFRVMLAVVFLGKATRPKYGGFEGTRVSSQGGGYQYTMRGAYMADWTQIDHCAKNNYGTSFSYDSNNKQLSPGATYFVTRGAQRSFICDWDHKWTSGDNDGGLATDYAGRHKYHFYYSAENDRDKFLTLVHADGVSVTNFYAWADNGDPWGKGNLAYNDTRAYYNDSHIFGKTFYVDTWAAVKKSDGYWRLVAFDQKGEDYSLRLCEDGMNLVEEGGLEKWYLYVGEPCSKEMLTVIVPDEPVTLSGSRTIDKPAYIGKDKTFIVNSDGALFVDSVLVLQGKIINNGIIVVADGGAIVSWDYDLGVIENKGGDVIARTNSTILVKEYLAEQHQLIMSSYIVAGKIDIKDSIVDRKIDSVVIRSGETRVYDPFTVLKDGNKYKIGVQEDYVVKSYVRWDGSMHIDKNSVRAFGYDDLVK